MNERRTVRANRDLVSLGVGESYKGMLSGGIVKQIECHARGRCDEVRVASKS